MLGIYRVAAAVPELQIGNPEFNAQKIAELYLEAAEAGVAVVLFPELAISGVSCGAMFRAQTLQNAVRDALLHLINLTDRANPVALVGVPWTIQGRLYNTVAVLGHGRLLGLAVKQQLSGGEAHEAQFFTPGAQLNVDSINFFGEKVPVGSLLFATDEGFRFGIEIGSEGKLPHDPAADLVQHGATAIFHPASPWETVTGRAQRCNFARFTSARLQALYVNANAGIGESVTSGAASGHAVIAENGQVVAENTRFAASSIIYHDFKPQWLEAQRQSRGGFPAASVPVQLVPIDSLPEAPDLEYLLLDAHPFVPQDPAELEVRCQEILDIQSHALARRMARINAKKLVIGLSGGLDSTLAVLACAKCCDLLKLDRSAIVGVTMPGFGTSCRTRNNATGIARYLGAELREIPIGEAVKQHFAAIGHDPKDLNVVYENSQARERTQILMDLANALNGIVVGTGDLSEIALGWSTFNGDHMSMYCVNCDVPKTIIRPIIAAYAKQVGGQLGEMLLDVNATPVSPELLPGVQHTEKLLGSYDLHDFYLFYFFQYGETPEVIQQLAQVAFPDEDPEEIKRTVKLFFRRFVSQQFKRNTMPDGPRIGSVNLDPQTSWSMPSDLYF